MAKGFVKLHRDLQAHWLWNKEPFTKGQAWVDLLLTVNHAPARIRLESQYIDIERGQTVTSTYKLAARWKWGDKKVRLFLRELEADGMVAKITTHKYTILTVKNYDKWHSDSAAAEGAVTPQSRSEKGRTETLENTETGRIEGAVTPQSRSEKGQQTRSKEIKNEKNKDIKIKELKSKTVKAADPIPYEKVVDLFHSACPSLPGIIKLTDNRRKQIAARWHEYGQGIKPFYKLFHLAEASAFLKGQNNRQWTATLDWLLKADNMAKTLEGRYGNGTGGDGDARNGSGTGKSDQYSGISIDLDELEM